MYRNYPVSALVCVSPTADTAAGVGGAAEHSSIWGPSIVACPRKKVDALTPKTEASGPEFNGTVIACFPCGGSSLLSKGLIKWSTIYTL